MPHFGNQLSKKVLILFVTTIMKPRIIPFLAVCLGLFIQDTEASYGTTIKSSFCGTTCWAQVFKSDSPKNARCSGISTTLTMRKQKASDRRTRRLQRGDGEVLKQREFMGSVTSSPMQQAGSWSQKSLAATEPQALTDGNNKAAIGGRGRSRKRSTLYNTLASYHDKFFSLLTAEYRAEVSLVGHRGRFMSHWHVESSVSVKLNRSSLNYYFLYRRKKF
jgi:hypothetical protein